MHNHNPYSLCLREPPHDISNVSARVLHAAKPEPAPPLPNRKAEEEACLLRIHPSTQTVKREPIARLRLYRKELEHISHSVLISVLIYLTILDAAFQCGSHPPYSSVGPYLGLCTNRSSEMLIITAAAFSVCASAVPGMGGCACAGMGIQGHGQGLLTATG